MIELINVSKYYVTDFGRHYVFRNVSLKLPLDKSVAVIGPNGAGKSTFLRLLGGADIPSEGRILKTGRISPPMGLTPGLQSTLTAAENARFAGRIYGMERDEIARLIEFVRELSRIGKFFDMPVGTYSAGMKQRVAFAINMSMTFDYYLFDEVGAGGDREFRKSAKALIEERLKTSKFIIASHRRDELLDICDSGIVIRDGTLTFFDDIKDALATYNTEDDDASEEELKAKRRSRKGKPELTPEELALKAEKKSKRRSKKEKPEPTPEELALKAENKTKRRSKKEKPEPTPEELAVKAERKSKRHSKKSGPQPAAGELALKEERKMKRRSKKAAAEELAVTGGGNTISEPASAAPAVAQQPVLAPSIGGAQAVPPSDDRKARREERRARKLAQATPPDLPAAADDPAPEGDKAALTADDAKREARRAERRARKAASSTIEDTALAPPAGEPAESGEDLKARRKQRRAERRNAQSAAPAPDERESASPHGSQHQSDSAANDSGGDRHIDSRMPHGNT